jgi:hypothetical protein
VQTKSADTTLLSWLLKAQLIGVLAAIPVMAQIREAPVSPAIATQIARHQPSPFRFHERRFDGTVTSTNWSGYAVTGTNVTDVKGSWIVPAVNCSTTTTTSPRSRFQQQQDEYAAFWVGIDGYSSNTVEQIGTDSDCDGSQPTYYAWFEFYPRPGYLINNFPVSPGNIISAEVSYGSTTKQFTVTLSNLTTGSSFSTSMQLPSAARTSAEWITEAPSSGSGANSILALADFGTADFGQAYTPVSSTCYATVNGTAGPIGSFSTWESITMVSSSGVDEAIPSPLTNLNSFMMSYK